MRCKVGVIGTGALGRHHARLYKECDGAELVGIFDDNATTAQRVATEIGAKIFSSVDDLIANVDGVSVAVPTHLHHRLVRKLLLAGVHVLVEKPITETVSEARELVELARNNELILQVGHVERFNPVLSLIHDVPGAIRFIEAHRLAPYPPARPGLHPRGTEVSVVLDLMIHDIDVVLSLVDSEIERVDGVGISVMSPTADIANARLLFKDGTVANLTASRVSPERMRKIRLFKNAAYMSLDYQELKGEIAELTTKGIDRKSIPVKNSNALHDELIDFCRCINGLHKTGIMPEPRVSGVQGMRALEVAEMIINSFGNGFEAKNS